MRNRRKTIRALTLTELLVIMSVMVILLAISIPAAKKLSESLENSAGTRSIIDAAMSNARAMAVHEGHYAGVRFQQDSAGGQYLILIIHDPNQTGLANGFCAVKGRKPTALPQNVGATGCRVQQDWKNNKPDDWDLASNPSMADTCLNTNVSHVGMNDATTFSIVFSPSGKFAIHLVRLAIPPSGFRQDEPESPTPSGYQEENSVSGFRIYNKRELAKAQAIKPTPKPWTAVPTGLSNLDTEFVNPYTGELVKKN